MDRSLPTAGHKIGRYEVAGLLATGGMAEIFLARQTGPSGFERPVVIKRVLPHMARMRVFRDMFLDEARLIVSVRHPNVVPVHELGDERGDLFLVMEYLEGESLAMVAKRLRESGARLPVRAVLHLLSEACAGLHAAHELSDEGRPLGLVHRDVSPHNLFVLYSGQVKVIDFGIAKAADRTSRTQTGTVKGKFAYMAPEQLRGEDVDRRADVFSLGIVLHELLTGQPLFARANDMLVMQAVCLEPIVPPSALVSDLDPELERITMKALAQERDERYATAAAMRRDIVAFLNRLESDALPEEEVAALMREMFGDRILGKSEMLRRVRAGEHLTQIVGADTDSAALVLQPDASTGSSATAKSVQVLSLRAAAQRPRRTGWLVMGAAALVGGGVVLGLELGPGVGVSPRGPGGEAPATTVQPATTLVSEPAGVAASAAPSAATATPEPLGSSPAPPLSAAPSGSAPRPVARPPVKVSPTPSSKGFGRFD